jgi:hypothetical protein
VRALYVYVAAYGALVMGAAITLWRAGLLNRVTWINTTLVIVGALALGGMLLGLAKPR